MYKVPNTVRASHGQDGSVVLDIQQGRMLRLNLTGSFILTQLERGEGESQIIDGFGQHFCVSRDVAQTDVAEFLNALKKEGLVRDIPEEARP